ncbi:unnamed protein product, partial [Brassica oleracea var. botrytis]
FQTQNSNKKLNLKVHTLAQTITRDTALSSRRRDVLKPQQRGSVTIPSPPPPKRNTPETERRFTGLRRKLNGASPDLAGSNCLPKLTTSSLLLLFTGERQTRNHRRASIEQIEISSVTSSTKSTESPLEKPEKSKQNRHRNERTT